MKINCQGKLNFQRNLVEIYIEDFILINEPANHMDLPSVVCLQSALKNCPAAMILISHDQEFLNTLTQTKWIFEENEKDKYKIKVIL